MASLTVPIRIKRGNGPPTQLRQGELAFDQENTKLYIGSGTEVGGYAPNVVELLTPATVLENLSNVSVGSGASDGDVLVYDSANDEWVAQALAAASVAWGDITGKPATFAPEAHTHGSISDDGKIGSASGLPIKTGADGVLEVGAFGTGEGQFAEGNHTHDAADITSLANVAKSGSYSDLQNIPSTFTPAAHNHTVTLEMCGLIESPEAKTYVISPAIPAAITITNVKAKTSEGTVDIKLQDDGVDITNTTIGDVGTSVAAPGTAPSASVAADSVLALVVSDLQTSPKNLAFTIHYTVTSANNA